VHFGHVLLFSHGFFGHFNWETAQGSRHFRKAVDLFQALVFEPGFQLLSVLVVQAPGEKSGVIAVAYAPSAFDFAARFSN
jgi:hypothetical protein